MTHSSSHHQYFILSYQKTFYQWRTSARTLDHILCLTTVPPNYETPSITIIIRNLLPTSIHPDSDQGQNEIDSRVLSVRCSKNTQTLTRQTFASSRCLEKATPFNTGTSARWRLREVWECWCNHLSSHEYREEPGRCKWIVVSITNIILDPPIHSLCPTSRTISCRQTLRIRK